MMPICFTHLNEFSYSLWLHITDQDHVHFLWNCFQVNATEPEDHRSIPVQVITWCHYTIWGNADPDLLCHMVSLGHNAFTTDFSNNFHKQTVPINLLWFSDTIWYHRSGSGLTQRSGNGLLCNDTMPLPARQTTTSTIVSIITYEVL